MMESINEQIYYVIAIMEMGGQYIMNKRKSFNYMSEGEGK